MSIAAIRNPVISILGGTQAGIRIIKSILKNHDILNKVTIQLFEPSSHVYYSDMLPFMATNHVTPFNTRRPLSEILPPEVHFSRELPAGIDTQNQSLLMNSGEKHYYDYLVISSLGQNDYSKIEGLKQAIEDPKTPVTCTNDYNSAIKYKNHLETFRGGRTQFYVPEWNKDFLDSISIANMSLEYLMKKSLNFHLLFKTDIIAQGSLPQKHISEYESLGALANFRKKFELYEHENLTLKEIDSSKNVALYQEGNAKKLKPLPFDLLHVYPEQILPEAFRSLPNLNNKSIEVDRKSLKVKGFDNIWSLGYCADLGSTTFLNLSKQADVIADNLQNSLLHGGKLLNKEYQEQNATHLYIGDQKVFDHNSPFELDSWKPRLNYYNSTVVEPIKYKRFL